MTVQPDHHIPVPIDEAADILGVRSRVLEDLIRWGELPSVIVDNRLALDHSTLDGLFETGIGTNGDDGPDLEL